jgi:hypothetical protein
MNRCHGADLTEHTRVLYYDVLNRDERLDGTHLAVAHVRKIAERIESLDMPAGSIDTESALRTWVAVADADWKRKSAVMALPSGAAKQYAPVALVPGAWLVGFIDIANAHTALGVDALLLRSYHLGGGDSNLHRGNMFRDTLAAHSIHLAETKSIAFTEDVSIADASYIWGLVALGLGLDVTTLGAYAVGYNLFVHAVRGPESAADFAFDSRESTAFFRPDPAAVATHREIAIRMVLQTIAEHDDRAVAAERIRKGVMLGWELASSWRNEVTKLLGTNPTVEDEMLDLVKRKAKYGRGYHRERCLAGRSLDTQLQEAQEDARPLVDALASSPYVVAGKPEQSHFLVRSTAFGGPMFNVFSPIERDLVARWIEALPARQTASDPALQADASPDPSANHERPLASRRLDGTKRAERRLPRISERQLFHLMLTQPLDPVVRRRATERTEHMLKAIRLNGKPKFFHYTPEHFSEWYEITHREQVAAYKPVTEQWLTKEEFCWVLLQLAPTVLADGSWLRSAALPGRDDTSIAGNLFRIYADEIGDGIRHQHHGNIYRELISSVRQELPPFTSTAFVESPLFIDGAFACPNHQMAISLSGQRYVAELLGLNLAIEFSGLGGDYMKAIDMFRSYGLDPYLVELHNTIDNPSSGHTMLSRRVVEQHLEMAYSMGGDELRQAEWRRIFCGYLSFKASTRPFGLGVVRKLGLKLGARMVRSLSTKLLAHARSATTSLYR